ncbi:MAG: sodium:proton antiporter, partial [Hyphomicrobiales bacterium]|nr:sodium:proton antiporter [Hyphomicrobiales bacterium]
MLANLVTAFLAAAFVVLPEQAQAAAAIDGSGMSLLWVIPFAGLLLCIATGPLLFHHVWEHHYGKISAFWAAMVIIPLYLSFDASAATKGVAFAMLLEY